MAKKLDKSILLSALVISGLLFIAGILVGYSLNTQKLSTIEQKMMDITNSMQNFQFQMLFFDTMGKNASCPVLAGVMNSVTSDYEKLGTKLTVGPDSELRDFSDYNRLLTDYYRVSINYWLLANKVKQNCDSNFTTVLFFISKSCSTKSPNPCDDESFVLNYYKTKFGDSLLIFTISADIGEPSIQALKQYYSVAVYPSIVLNGTTYSGFQSSDKIRDILCSSGLCI